MEGTVNHSINAPVDKKEKERKRRPWLKCYFRCGGISAQLLQPPNKLHVRRGGEKKKKRGRGGERAFAAHPCPITRQSIGSRIKSVLLSN